ncbi:hypothetical protein C5167_036445 [Papaver somniferum]|uniref:Leucine-rich repeat-containing N-terminal plant-type domain-containing protein n=1 Tax=Papaver somniferum TaxID=3469 RepID=A0A4Y7I717_PAPSO|nr:hypothetical protein C5167_036445 [Papaver somniferum]
MVLLLLSCVLLKISAQTEAEALIKWKNSLDFHSLTSWSLANGRTNPCRWSGIKCGSSDSVIEINLDSSGVNGKLDQFNFSVFPKLTYLNLANNNLSGTMPAEIGKLAELRFLRLANNTLTGPIPYQVCNLQKLRNLELSENYLSNPDSTQCKGMASLTRLDLNYNYLASEVPPFIFKSPKLAYVDISDNTDIGGPLPIQFMKTLKNIQFLNLSGNSFKGPIPAEIGNLTQLQDLRLSRNQLNGSIPSEIVSQPQNS